MLSDVKYRRTAGCKMFESTVARKKLNKFPIQEVDCENMDIDELMIKSEFNMPFVVKGVSDKLGIKVLPRNHTLTDVANVIGRSFPIKMIEVAEQSEIEGKLGEYADYLKGYTPLHKIINMISLEFSTTPLSNVIHAPQFVRDIDWIDTVWPLDRKMTNDYPKVQKYCLSGMASSYTDFHIDFGGTSVWYHVVNGKKRFYLVAPTLRNLQLFREWSKSSAQADTFFGDIVGLEECFEYDLNPGDTFMIPSGWIHAVYTPEDSLVFGGNFLHKNAILRQMQVYQIEGSTKVGQKYRFPLFREINWYTLCLVLPLALAKYCPQMSEQSFDEIDTSDYDPEVVKMYENLNTSHLFHQFVFLVRICDEWAGLIKGPEYDTFLKIAKEYAHLDIVHEVTQKWWTVLESIAALLDSESDDRGGDGRSHLEFVESIRRYEGSINLLDEKVVSRALSSFDNQVRSIYASINYTPAVHSATSAAASQSVPEEKLSLTLKLRPKVTPVKPAAETNSSSTAEQLLMVKRLPHENPLASDTSSSYDETLPSTVIDSEYSGEGAVTAAKRNHAKEEEEAELPHPPADLTSLKFKLPRRSAPTPVKEQAPIPPASAAPPAPAVVSTPEIKFKLDTVASPPSVPFTSMAAVVPSTSSASDDIPRPIGREEALKLKRIQEKNKAKEMLTADTTATGATATKPTRFKITMSASKPPPPKAPSNTVGMKSESEGQRKYGTRGLKLSNDFLRNAMDVDFAETESGSASKKYKDDDVREEEEEEEEEFHFVDAESRMKGASMVTVAEKCVDCNAGGDEYSVDSDGEEADDVVEYDSADDSDHREYSRRALYTVETATTGEDDAAQSDDDSDDGEGVRRRTVKRSRDAPSKSAAVLGQVKKRRVTAAERDEQQQQAKKPFVVDRVSYNSYMGIPQNQPVMAPSVPAPASSFPQAKPMVKPKGGRAAIMKKLGIHR